jgi:hypothetical protein
MNKYTHDFNGNAVDGFFWVLLEENFQKAASTFRSAGNDRAAEIAEWLVETADDVPAELVLGQMLF